MRGSLIEVIRQKAAQATLSLTLVDIHCKRTVRLQNWLLYSIGHHFVDIIMSCTSFCPVRSVPRVTPAGIFNFPAEHMCTGTPSGYLGIILRLGDHSQTPRDVQRSAGQISLSEKACFIILNIIHVCPTNTSKLCFTVRLCSRRKLTKEEETNLAV